VEKCADPRACGEHCVNASVRRANNGAVAVIRKNRVRGAIGEKANIWTRERKSVKMGPLDGKKVKKVFLYQK